MQNNGKAVEVRLAVCFRGMWRQNFFCGCVYSSNLFFLGVVDLALLLQDCEPHTLALGQ